MLKNKKKLILNVCIGIFFLIGILTFYSTFSLENDYKFESLVYNIEDNYIEGISVNTSIELFVKYFDLENCSIEVVGLNNEKIVNGYVVNSSKTIVYDVNGNVIATYVNIVKGDYNNDGMVDNNDFYEMGKCLVSKCSMDEYLEKSVDIDDDGEFHINDLVLLDKAITGGYNDISLKEDSIILQSEEKGRLVAKVTPSYGINQNLKWVSLDESIVTVDDAGIVIGHKEGEAKVRVSTLDGKVSKEATIKVDNTIQLLSTSGVGYIGGKDVVVGIKSIDYDGITCSVSNESIVDCEIQDKKLVLKPKNVGSAVVTVTSPKYGKVTYSLETYSVYLNVMPKYLCLRPEGSNLITVSGFNSGELTFDFSDKDIIDNAYMVDYSGRRMLRIDAGMKQGRATLTVTEEHANTNNIVTVDVYNFTLADIGKVSKVGEEVSTTILGENLGELSCASRDNSKGTCRIEGNQLIVTPLVTGSVTVDVYNKLSYNGQLYDCGNTLFMVVAQE
ncbi:MAG: Ig-like domain-containing protein [Bacilli bacterium]|nr:Ig-like domain-containing protein [Bacilli bacterium]